MADKYLFGKIPNPCNIETKGMSGKFGDFIATLKPLIIVDCDCCITLRVFLIMFIGMFSGFFMSHLTYGSIDMAFVRAFASTAFLAIFISTFGMMYTHMYNKINGE